MLTITVGTTEHFDEESNEFVQLGGFTIELEHSLASLSKWESKWEKAFLGPGERTHEEVLGYIEAMIISKDFPPDVISRLSQDNIDQINKYIDAKMTATWFNDKTPAAKSREVITAELIYYWLFSAGIPLECEHWHLSKLFTLIKVYGVKNSKPKPMSKAELQAHNRAENARRRAEMGTRG